MPLLGTLSIFLHRIDEIKFHADFVNNSVSMVQNIAPYINQQSLSHNPQLRRDYFAYKKIATRIRPDDIRASFLLQAYAAFEWFIHALLIVSVEYTDTKIDKFVDLPPAIARTNYHLSGRTLAIQAQAKQHSKVDVDQYCKNLGGCYTESESFSLNAGAFGLFIKNINGESLPEMLKRVGYKMDWEVIGADSEVKKFVGETSKRKAGKVAKELLDQLSSKRNEIAHQGDGSKVVSNDELTRYLEFLITISNSLISDLNNHVSLP